MNRLRRAVLALLVLVPLGCSASGKDPAQAPSPPSNWTETHSAPVRATPHPVAPLADTKYRKYCHSGDPMEGVWSPGRLTVKNWCVAVTGVVSSIGHNQDGDFHVDLVQVDRKWLNSVNITRQDAALVTEIVPKLPTPNPAIGSKVTVIGPWVLDTDTGWLEIHPVWKILPAS